MAMTRKTATPPAKEGNGQKRQFVRLEIFSPIMFNSIVVDAENKVRLHPEKKAGVLLNLSGGGVLLSTTDRTTEGEYLFMKFDIKGFNALTSVLGKVKRVEDTEDGERLVGIEFMALEQIDNPAIATGMSRLVDNPAEFSQGLSRLVSRYVFSRQIEAETE